MNVPIELDSPEFQRFFQRTRVQNDLEVSQAILLMKFQLDIKMNLFPFGHWTATILVMILATVRELIREIIELKSHLPSCLHYRHCHGRCQGQKTLKRRLDYPKNSNITDNKNSFIHNNQFNRTK